MLGLPSIMAKRSTQVKQMQSGYSMDFCLYNANSASCFLSFSAAERPPSLFPCSLFLLPCSASHFQTQVPKTHSLTRAAVSASSTCNERMQGSYIAGTQLADQATRSCCLLTIDGISMIRLIAKRAHLLMMQSAGFVHANDK